MKHSAKVDVALRVVVELDEREARFLNALVCYGGQALVDAIKKSCGTHYIEPYESVAVPLCKAIYQATGEALSATDRARNAIASEGK